MLTEALGYIAYVTNLHYGRGVKGVVKAILFLCGRAAKEEDEKGTLEKVI